MSEIMAIWVARDYPESPRGRLILLEDEIPNVGDIVIAYPDIGRWTVESLKEWGREQLPYIRDKDRWPVRLKVVQSGKGYTSIFTSRGADTYLEATLASNPCIEKSFEAVDEAGHKIRAVIGIDDGVRAFSICHTEDSKEHVCYTSVEKPEDQYQFVKKMFESWGYGLKEVDVDRCGTAKREVKRVEDFLR